MEQKQTGWLFIVLTGIALGIFFVDRAGILLGLRASLEGAVSPAQRSVQKLIKDDLDEQKLIIDEKLAHIDQLQKENEALRIQVGVAKESGISGKKILLAHVLSSLRFFIIDKGSDDGVAAGQTVFFKNVFIGKIVAVSQKVSRLQRPTEAGSVISARAKETGAVGLAKGQGDSMVFSDVILSENLAAGDSVQTVGNVDENGIGILPNFIIGTAQNVRKSSDQLFWEANVVPALEYRKLEEVFVAL
ncbi:rod shape-determining protein MreC [Candidatus Microgenomates bacterium]|nr:rod shape-determining protein MreC [Candidatus Microgenomates bacterium]